MSDKPKTSEQPSGQLRWRESREWSEHAGRPVLQQLWYITTYLDGFAQGDGRGVKQREEWRDVPVVSE